MSDNVIILFFVYLFVILEEGAGFCEFGWLAIGRTSKR